MVQISMKENSQSAPPCGRRWVRWEPSVRRDKRSTSSLKDKGHFLALKLRNRPRRRMNELKRIIIPRITITASNSIYMAPSPRQALSDQGVLRISCRIIKIATWNVRSLNKSGTLANAEKEMEIMRWDVLGTSEVQRKGQ